MNAKLWAAFPSLPEASGGACVAGPQGVDSASGNRLVRQVKLRLKTDEDLVADLPANEPDATRPARDDPRVGTKG
jgi:hypothetical protein